jgi:ABC-type branched-subunit amino acid transport system substrate-binding protein
MDDTVELMGPIFSTSLSSSFWTKWNTLSADILAQASTKPLLYAPPTVSPPMCSENIVFFGPTASQRMKPLELYLQSYSIDGLVIIQYDEDHYSSESARFAESLCSDSITCLGSIILSSNTDEDGLDAMINTLTSSGNSRIVIVNLILGSSGNIPLLFDKIEALNARILETNQRYFVISTMVDETQLVPSMQGHHAVSSYFKDVNSPTNFAFKSIFAGRNGDGFVLTEGTEKAYSAILAWASSVELADSFDHVKTRVSGYNVRYSYVSFNTMLVS